MFPNEERRILGTRLGRGNRRYAGSEQVPLTCMASPSSVPLHTLFPRRISGESMQGLHCEQCAVRQMDPRFSRKLASSWNRIRVGQESLNGPKPMTLPVVQSLWIGNRLSTMESLAIRSFLAQGHPFDLYAYGPLDNVPPGTNLRDGREILPQEDVFVYRRGPGKGSPSAFSNCFRYKLLLERGGWWSDLDAVCLRPLEFESQHLTGWEREPNGTEHVAAGLMKMPVGSRLAAFCWEQCQQAQKERVRWGQLGPRLLARGMSETEVEIEVLAPDLLYPIDYWNCQALVEETPLPAESYSVHLWNSQWRAAGIDPDGRFPESCLYERLKRQFGCPTLVAPQVPRRRRWWQRIVQPWRRRAA